MASLVKARQLGIYIIAYWDDNEAWPDDLNAIYEVGYVPHEADLLTNPRKGFSGYYFEKPDFEYDDIESPSEFSWLFEVRDDGTIMCDSGVIGYADGHVAYVRAGE